MPVTPDVGTGATLTFSTSTDAFSITSMQMSGLEFTSVETTFLGTTTARTFIRGDLYDPGTLNATILYDAQGQPATIASSTYSSQTLTLTYPIPVGKTSGATAAVTGFLLTFDQPSLEVDSLMTAQLSFKLSGPISFTASTS